MKILLLVLQGNQNMGQYKNRNIQKWDICGMKRSINEYGTQEQINILITIKHACYQAPASLKTYYWHFIFQFSRLAWSGTLRRWPTHRTRARSWFWLFPWSETTESRMQKSSRNTISFSKAMALYSKYLKAGLVCNVRNPSMYSHWNRPNVRNPNWPKMGDHFVRILALFGFRTFSFRHSTVTSCKKWKKMF